MSASAARMRGWDALGWAGRRAGYIQGWSVDEEAHTVTYYVIADEAIPPFPSQVDGFTVLLAPLPRAQAFLRRNAAR
jgi:hypothetical protein